MHKFTLAFLFMMLFLAGLSNAATIHGTVYDLSLRKIDNAKVEINTSPKQIKVAENGTYSFNVPNGIYRIKAQLMQKNEVMASVEENITIAQDGSYVLDLILFPNIDEGVEDPGIEVNGSVIDEDNGNDKIFLLGFIVLFFSGIAAGIAYFLKTRKKDEANAESQENETGSEDIEQVIKVIKQEGGRTTQKEIRKQIPLSEAKISLMIAELEHNGIVEKIKKGRGNIIILKKK
ncbi:hypothetical protein HYX08_05530 [Candidatus Woesearchaeota archaeon]|nr:hypothetical protein [Candidatus Woesearchaeota archaeon]